MKIILLKDVKKQGKSGDILEVKDGYGNFLISKGDAVVATKVSVNILDKENKEREANELLNIKKCEELKKKLEKTNISFKVKTGAQDKVFGSISSKQIVDELKKLGFDINKTQIKLDTPLSSLGTHIVHIELHKKVIANIKVKLEK
jgi:large subunit ribosomal protein L9